MAANKKVKTGGSTKSAGGAKAGKKASFQMYCPGSTPGSGGIVTCTGPITRAECCKRSAGNQEQ